MWGVSRRRFELKMLKSKSRRLPPMSPYMSSASSIKNFPVLELLSSLVALKLRCLGPDEDPIPTFEIKLRDDTRQWYATRRCRWPARWCACLSNRDSGDGKTAKECFPMFISSRIRTFESDTTRARRGRFREA